MLWVDRQWIGSRRGKGRRVRKGSRGASPLLDHVRPTLPLMRTWKLLIRTARHVPDLGQG
jgi:hypothetical protein